MTDWTAAEIRIMASEAGTIDATDGFRVTLWLHLLGGFVSRHRGLWTWLGNMETRGISDLLAPIVVHQPLYIAGLARSGSTILLEILARHPDLSAHRYRDYPMLFTPFWWNRYLANTPKLAAEAVERTHQDGIFITPESPEAFEEVLWMAFFPDQHDPLKSAVLTEATDNPAFETFYRDHIRKLLLTRGGRRYLSKGNYNVTRLAYLLKIFEDARIVLPVRAPVWHIASLIRQHRHFCRGQKAHPRAVAHLQRAGHFEFGEDRRPINTGDNEQTAQIVALWESGMEVEGWARYWACIHNYLADQLEMNRRLHEAVMIVRHEALCDDPTGTMRAVLDHCNLSADEDILRLTAQRIRPARLNRPGFFSDADLDAIEHYTRAAAARFGLEWRLQG
jgi:hypothetical protein